MTAKVVVLGRKILVWTVTVAGALDLAAQCLAAAVSGRSSEAWVFLFATILMGFLGSTIEILKAFLGE